MPLRVDPSPHNFNSLPRAGGNSGVLACKIGALNRKLVVCATRAEANLDVLACKISVLRQKLVIICVTRARANLGVFALKIRIFVKN